MVLAFVIMETEKWLLAYRRVRDSSKELDSKLHFLKPTYLVAEVVTILKALPDTFLIFFPT